VAQDLAVQLFEGSIELAGPVVDRRVLRPGDELSVQGGSRLEFVDGARRAGVDAAVPAPPEPQAPVVDPDAGAASESPPAPASPAIAPKRPEPWEGRARGAGLGRGDPPGGGSGFRQLTGSLDVERQLAARGRGAVQHGQTGRAVEALSALRRRFPRRPEHHEAAYLLGRVHADQRKDPVEGRALVRDGLRRGAGRGPLAEESLARALELAVARSDGGKGAGAGGRVSCPLPAGPHASWRGGARSRRKVPDVLVPMLLGDAGRRAGVAAQRPRGAQRQLCRPDNPPALRGELTALGVHRGAGRAGLGAHLAGAAAEGAGRPGGRGPCKIEQVAGELELWGSATWRRVKVLIRALPRRQGALWRGWSR
jgi:hypothetical protein